MGVSTAHHGSASTSERDFHDALRSRYEHHFHPLDLLHSRRARPFLWFLVLLALAFSSYRIGSHRGHERLASKNAEYRALIADRRAEEATLELKLQRQEHSIRTNEDGAQAYRRQIEAKRQELERATRTLASTRRELGSIEASIAQLDATLADKHQQSSVHAAELERLREEQSALKEERDRLRIEVQRLGSRLDDAKAELAEEQRLASFRRSKP